jgi:hypothetical protein
MYSGGGGVVVVGGGGVVGGVVGGGVVGGGVVVVVGGGGAGDWAADGVARTDAAIAPASTATGQLYARTRRLSLMVGV